MFLLDVNVLLAMHYPRHVHHARVKAWTLLMTAELGRDHIVFATCPITELGFVRVASSKAAYAESVDAARLDLRALKSSENMLFIPDDMHTGHLPEWVTKSTQTTDAYLLELAKLHGGRLVTLDRFIPGAMLIPGDDDAGPLKVREEAAIPYGSRQPQYREPAQASVNR